MKKLIINLILFVLFFSFTYVAQAQNLSNWDNVLDSAARTSGYDTKIQTPEPVIAKVIKTLLSLLGVLFLILMVYGGFLWMLARGNEDQVIKSKNLITAAIIGLIIVLLSYAISIFVIDALTESTLTF